MKIIIRNRPILLISQVLLASYLPTSLNTAQAANAALTEAPPPWAVRQDVQVANPLPEAAAAAAETREAVQATPQPSARTVKSNNSIEQWYAQRQGYTAPVKSSAPELKTKATQGDLNAQYALALRLRQAPTPENIAESLRLQEKAARGGHVEAQYGLGVLYSNGQYVALDQRLANFWYTQAAKRGSEAAKLALGGFSNEITPAAVTARATADNSQALVPAPRSTNENNGQVATTVTSNESMFAPTEAESTPGLPTMSAEEYAALEQSGAETALPTQPSVQTQAAPVTQAVQRRAAQAVPTVAQAPEAVMPAEGAAGAEGATEALTPETEADPGDISVEHNESKVDLGNMSVQEVINTAQKGDMYAQLMLGALFEDGTDPSIPQDINEAAKWYAKAAKQGYPKAQHNLALLYEDGRGLPQSYTEAAKWYTKAAKAGFSEAQNNLAVLYIMGNGVKQNRAQAEKLLTAAVAQGNENARRNLQKLLEGAAS